MVVTWPGAPTRLAQTEQVPLSGTMIRYGGEGAKPALLCWGYALTTNLHADFVEFHADQTLYTY